MTGNPYVFVGGCPRSGTTLLQRMLDNHHQLAVCNEANVVPRRAMKLEAGPELALTRKFVEQVVGNQYFPELGIDERAALALAASVDTLVAFVKALLDEHARRNGKPLAGDKVPEYIRYRPSLHRMFPSARSIHLIRDGRDVALSTVNWMTPAGFLRRKYLWREEPVALWALRWRRQVLEGQRGRDRVGAEHCLEVRYEDLVQTPEAVMRSIASFLELPFDMATVEYHRGKTRHDASLPSTDRWLPPTVGLRDWRVDLSPRDLQLFEVLAGDLLASLGYPLAADTSVSPEVTATAKRCRRWWEIEVGRQPRA